MPLTACAGTHHAAHWRGTGWRADRRCTWSLGLVPAARGLPARQLLLEHRSVGCPQDFWSEIRRAILASVGVERRRQAQELCKGSVPRARQPAEAVVAICIQDANTNGLASLGPAAVIIRHRSLAFNNAAWALFACWKDRRHWLGTPTRVEVCLKGEGVANLAVSMDRCPSCAMLARCLSSFVRRTILEVARIDIEMRGVQLAQPCKSDIPSLPQARVFVAK